MTTIAYKDRKMACDSAWSDEGTILTRRSKIVRLQSGALLGSGGDDDCRELEGLLAKVKTPAHLPTRKQLLDLVMDYTGILVLPSGRMYAINIEHKKGHWEGGLFEVAESYYACGSGGVHALTAMECGKSAKDAVTISCRRDSASCLPVHVVELAPLKTARRK